MFNNYYFEVPYFRKGRHSNTDSNIDVPFCHFPVPKYVTDIKFSLRFSLKHNEKHYHA
jgi:hypothetical protein